MLMLADLLELAELEGVKLSTSFLIILPFSAEPLTWLKSIPFSSANFLANGDALTLESEELVSTCATAGALAATGAAAGSSFLVSAATATGASVNNDL